MSEFEKFIEDNFKELKSRIESGNFFAKTMRDSMHATWLKQQSEIDQLEVQLSLQRDRNKALEAELTSSRNYGDQLKAEKGLQELEINQLAHANQEWQRLNSEKEKGIEKLKAEKAGFKDLIKSLRSEFDLNGGSDQVERQIELLEEAVRGDS